MAIRAEISSLINELVDLEYKDFEEDLTTPMPLASEDETLGFMKFASSQLNLPNKKQTKQRFIDRIREESSETFTSEDYLEGPKWDQLNDSSIKTRPNQTCNCLGEYYNVQSQCF